MVGGVPLLEEDGGEDTYTYSGEGTELIISDEEIPLITGKDEVG